MTKIKGLDKRLRAVLDNINNIEVLADIGADHGKISVGARLENRAKRVIAVDISEKSLQKTRNLALKYQVDNIDYIVGDGIIPIKESIDLAVISGMGGREIIKILKESNYQGSAILVPHQDEILLRDYLSTRFGIVKDYIVEVKDKFYSIIITQKGSYSYNASEIPYGKNCPNTTAYNNMLIARWNKINAIKQNHTLPKGEGLGKEYNLLKDLMDKLKLK